MVPYTVSFPVFRRALPSLHPPHHHHHPSSAIALPTSIIGSNFMNEWAEYRRLQFQARLRKNQKLAAAEGGGAFSIYSGLAGSHGKKIQMHMVKEQNHVMLETLVEIQEKLANINPPRYYRKYAKTKIELQEAVAHIAKLELEIARLRKVNTNLNKFNSFFKKQSGDPNSAATGGMDDEFTQLMDASNPTENDLNATFSITGKAREKSVAVLNTIFRRATTAVNSGAATPAFLRTEANSSVNNSVSNTLTNVAAALAHITESSGNGWPAANAGLRAVERTAPALDKQQRQPDHHSFGRGARGAAVPKRWEHPRQHLRATHAADDVGTSDDVVAPHGDTAVEEVEHGRFRWRRAKFRAIVVRYGTEKGRKEGRKGEEEGGDASREDHEGDDWRADGSEEGIHAESREEGSPLG
ncbi:hypothetical protein BC938DRAFT_473193 [Jimgerdemannia flammicorona]|uniref:Uncharacterized protein n=1 Tax=Jimgerdemannia flammicorona TaxID=994334 RepID=A0A433Q4K8_9FUNG|nr:hypothetical protein BC938DRAFT_473193 [Jimgerdemannia flammicorona]